MVLAIVSRILFANFLIIKINILIIGNSLADSFKLLIAKTNIFVSESFDQNTLIALKKKKTDGQFLIGELESLVSMCE